MVVVRVGDGVYAKVLVREVGLGRRPRLGLPNPRQSEPVRLTEV